MSKNRFELDSERLGTVDEHGNRVYLHPEDVKGIWKDRRDIVYWILIGLYLVLPWIYINKKPALLIDIINREFTFMGSTFFGVDPILFFLIIISSIFFIAFMTSLFGRVWCGWGCPQTVFISSLFLKVESFIEGSARERRALDEAPMSAEKFFKKALKWIIFAVISLHIAHTFIGYFIGPRELFHMTMGSPLEHFGIFSATMIITTIFLLDFGWFREQFCIIACPYGRMQSVIMDENSLVIAYDKKRGEPRRGTPGILRENEGDCINCYNCVKVCPTGIDIRRGTQLECIACTNCIDACDEIMIKMKRPTGLIRYGSENELNGVPRKTITPRSMIYAAISLLFVGIFILFINKSTDLQILFLRGSETFTYIDQTVTNRFTVKFNHQGGADYKVVLKVHDPAMQDKIKIITPVSPIDLVSFEKKVIVFFKFPPTLLESGTKKINIDIVDHSSGNIIATKEVVLVGPVH
nr:cytochrome c oxidase accessory protein CcoG [Bacteriovorax sp. HI3]